MKLAVYKIDGSASGKEAILDDSIFAIEPNDHAIYLDVKQYLADQRQGTHKSKERWEVAHSTKKMGRQKGGGGARHGSIKANIYVGGGRVFGPKPRDYSFKLNKKVRQLARKSALSYKAQENALMVVEDFTFDAPKTKAMVEILNNLKVSDKKALFVLPGADKVVYLSARNIERVQVMPANALNTYKVLNADVMVVAEGALAVIEGNLTK